MSVAFKAELQIYDIFERYTVLQKYIVFYFPTLLISFEDVCGGMGSKYVFKLIRG